MDDLRKQFIEFAITHKVLLFGEFKTKAGRLSPYFFNLGAIDDGASLARLATFYAKTIAASGVEFDMLFGPAYKGIPLVAAISIALSEAGRNSQFCFNRKEAKGHGEGGEVIGAALRGRVLIVDDVISAGTSFREAVDLIRRHGALPSALVVALDRMERGQGTLSATQEVIAQYRIPVLSIADLDDLVSFLEIRPCYKAALKSVANYRQRYGVMGNAS
jgi:orotate phosphoribosyltransferase